MYSGESWTSIVIRSWVPGSVACQASQRAVNNSETMQGSRLDKQDKQLTIGTGGIHLSTGG